MSDQQLDLFRDRNVEVPLRDPGRDSIGQFHAPESGAPDTERAAAILAYPSTGTARLRVLAFLMARDERGATDEEIAEALQMRLYTAAPRRNELKRDGWVAASGEKRATSTGTPAMVWRVTAQGRREWREDA